MASFDAKGLETFFSLVPIIKSQLYSQDRVLLNHEYNEEQIVGQFMQIASESQC